MPRIGQTGAPDQILDAQIKQSIRFATAQPAIARMHARTQSLLLSDAAQLRRDDASKALAPYGEEAPRGSCHGGKFAGEGLQTPDDDDDMLYQLQ